MTFEEIIDSISYDRLFQYSNLDSSNKNIAFYSLLNLPVDCLSDEFSEELKNRIKERIDTFSLSKEIELVQKRTHDEIFYLNCSYVKLARTLSLMIAGFKTLRTSNTNNTENEFKEEIELILFYAKMLGVKEYVKNELNITQTTHPS